MDDAADYQKPALDAHRQWMRLAKEGLQRILRQLRAALPLIRTRHG